MKNIQRVLSFLLALVLLVGYLPPVHVHAEELENSVEETIAAMEDLLATEPAQETSVPADTATEAATEAPTQPETVPEETALPTEVTEPVEVTVTDGAAMASTVVASGTCGDNLTWKLDSEGTLTISGSGAMTGHGWPWSDKYESSIKTVIIKDGVTSIGTNAFAYCEKMISVSIPDSVTCIGTGAFGWCFRLESIVIPDSVTEICSAAFTYCTSLTSIVIPNSVTSIADCVFESCSKLKSITFEGDAPQERCYGCLYGVEATVYYPANNPTWRSDVMKACEGDVWENKITWVPYESSGDNLIASGTCGENLTWTLNEKGTLTIFGTGAMRDWSYTNPWYTHRELVQAVIIEKGITHVGEYAFWNCENLASVSIADSVTSIGRYAFSICESLDSVSMADSVTSIDSFAFQGCIKLKNITIPDSVAKIGGLAFQWCENLTSVVIPSSVTSMGESVFEDCGKLEYVLFEGSAPYEAMDKCLSYAKTTVYYPTDNPTWTPEAIERCDPRGDNIWVPYGTMEYHNTLNELTAVDYLAFSQVAYEDFSIGETVQSCLTRLGNNKWHDVWGEEGITYAELCEGIAQWKACCIEENADNGFYAVAFRNDSGEAVLAYRGSKPLENVLQMFTDEQSYKDWVMNDLAMILINADNEQNQYNSAIMAYEKTEKVSGIHTIVTTGHSLGGLWGEIASAYSGCQGITFNAISALDIMYVKHPKELGESFQGVNVWNFKDHANVFDILAGMTEATSSGMVFGTKLKPYMSHTSNYIPHAFNWDSHHGLKSLVSRDGDRLKLNAVIGSWYAADGVSNHLSFTGGSVDMGISGNDYFNRGIYSGAFRTSFGGNGNDKIYGSIDTDVLVGGKGADTLDGGWGDDTYYYFKGDGSDTIIDCCGQDKLYLEGFNENDQISISTEDGSKYLQIKCNGNTIVQIYNSRVATIIWGAIGPGLIYPSTPIKPLSSFNICVNGDEIDITKHFSKRSYTTRLLIESSASLEILNSDGDQVYMLGTAREHTFYTDYGNFYIYKEDDGSCGKALDLAMGYTARIIGEESGTMNIEYWEIPLSGELPETTKMFTNVPVSGKFTATIEKTSDGELVLAADTDGDDVVDTKFGYDGKPVPVESVELTQDYIVLEPGEQFPLEANVKPVELAQFLSWSVEEGSEAVIRVAQDGTVTGLNVGTGYVLVTVANGDISSVARCRVDVARTGLPTDPTEPSGGSGDPIGPEGTTGLVSFGIVNTNQLNVYKEPDADSEVLKQLSLNTRVEISNEKTIDGIRWGYISDGWIDMQYITRYSPWDELSGFEESTQVDGTVILDGIQLSTAKATTELYKNEFATFEILLQLPQNYPADENALQISDSATNAVAGMENKSNLIESARFTSDAVAELFELVLLDDRTVQIVPTEKALENAKAVKSSYADTVTVTVQGKEYVSEKLTLTVKKTLPKLKATVAAFNSFYSGQTQEIAVTGGTVTSIYENEAKNTAKATAIPGWLTLNEDGTLTLTADAPLKNTSGKAYVMVETEEWRIPTALTLSVKNTYKAPGLKLSAATVTMTGLTENSDGVALKLVCSNKKDTLSGLNVTNMTTPAGFVIEDFNAQDGSFTLKAAEGFKAGKIALQVHFGDTTVTLPLNLTVKTATVALKLAPTTVTLNQAVSDSGEIKVTSTPADFRLENPAIRLTGTETINGKKTTVDKTASGELDIRYENGYIRIRTTDLTPEKASYKLYISAGGSKEAAATVNVVTAVPSVTLKATGSMDLSFPTQTATITATFKNYSGRIVSYDCTVAEMKGKTVVDEDVTGKFAIEQDGKTFRIRCTDESLNIANTYAVKLKLILEDGSSLEKSINLKVKRTAVKLKLSAAKLSLNKLIGDTGSINITCTTKGYAFDAPVWTLTDSKNKPAEGELTINYKNGQLTVSTNDATVYGKTYKIVLKANEYGTAATLTVSVPTQAKSIPTVTIKVAGKIDVIRDGSAVTVTPTYKNCITTTHAEETVTISNSKKEDVTSLFTITPNGKGGYTITKAEGAALPTGTYKVKLAANFGAVEIASKEVNMSVAMGAAKLKTVTTDTTLFAKDKNDRALVWFEAADATLNEVSSITFKNAKQAQMFEIIDYGGGLFAIGFKDGEVDKSLLASGKATSKTVTVSLNVFIEGNETTKTNATANVKLTIVK